MKIDVTHPSLATPYYVDCLCSPCKELRSSENTVICKCGFTLIASTNKLIECPRCKKLYPHEVRTKGSE